MKKRRTAVYKLLNPFTKPPGTDIILSCIMVFRFAEQNKCILQQQKHGRTEKMNTAIRYGILLLFVAAMSATGIISARKIKSTEDFMLGGGRLGGWFSAFAYGTTYFSAVVFIGYGGSVSWKYGLSSVWIGIGNALIGTLAAWLILGKSTYRAMERYQTDYALRLSCPTEGGRARLNLDAAWSCA